MSETTAEPTSPAEDEIDPFDSPAPGGKFPTIAQLKDRLCLFELQGIEDAVPDRFNAGKTKPRATVNVTFLDGGPIAEHVDKDGEATPFPEPIREGQTMVGMYISQTKMVSQLKGTKMVVGRVHLLPKIPGSTNNRAWGITDVPKLRKDDNAKVAAQAKADYATALRFVQSRDVFDS